MDQKLDELIHDGGQCDEQLFSSRTTHVRLPKAVSCLAKASVPNNFYYQVRSFVDRKARRVPQLASFSSRPQP